jgi:hypothetical protein
MIKIDKNVPLPAKASGKNGNKYPFREMKVGDSFFIEMPQAMASATTRTARLSGLGKYTTRREGSGTRIWRVE